MNSFRCYQLWIQLIFCCLFIWRKYTQRYWCCDVQLNEFCLKIMWLIEINSHRQNCCEFRTCRCTTCFWSWIEINQVFYRLLTQCQPLCPTVALYHITCICTLRTFTYTCYKRFSPRTVKKIFRESRLHLNSNN